MAVAITASASSPKSANPIPSGRNCTGTSAGAVVVVVSGTVVATVVTGVVVVVTSAVVVVTGAAVVEVVVLESKGRPPPESSPQAATTASKNTATMADDLRRIVSSSVGSAYTAQPDTAFMCFEETLRHHAVGRLTDPIATMTGGCRDLVRGRPRSSCQCSHHRPADLPVRSSEGGLPRWCDVDSGVNAPRCHRARVTPRLPGTAQHSTEIHDCLVPGRRICCDILRGDLLQSRTAQCSPYPSREHPSQVGVDGGNPFSKGDRCHRSRGVLPDTRE